MKFKMSLLIVLFLSINACSKKKAAAESPACARASCGSEVVDCRKDGTCHDEPDCSADGCHPNDSVCPDKGFEEAATIKEHPMRAAYCLNFSQEKKCKATQDFLVNCMTLAGDIDPIAYRERLAELNKIYAFDKK